MERMETMKKAAELGDEALDGITGGAPVLPPHLHRQKDGRKDPAAGVPSRQGAAPAGALRTGCRQ